MAKLAKPTKGEWFAIATMVETDNDDIPDVACCDPRIFGQNKMPFDHNTAIANAALMAESKNMLAILKRVLEQPDYKGQAEIRADIRSLIYRTKVEYMEHLKDPAMWLDYVSENLGHLVPGPIDP